METITDLQQQKRNKNRLNVFINGEYAFSVHATLGAELKIGRELTRAEVSKIIAQDAAQKAQEYSFRYLSYRPRSTGELRSYLRRKGFDHQLIYMVIDDLQNRDYLNDSDFAQFWIEQRQTHRPRGTFALRYELLQKGVAPEIIDAALVDIDEKDAAMRAAERSAGRWRNLPRDQYWRKISGFLQRRGFSYETIREVAEEVWLTFK